MAWDVKEEEVSIISHRQFFWKEREDCYHRRNCERGGMNLAEVLANRSFLTEGEKAEKDHTNKGSFHGWELEWN